MYSKITYMHTHLRFCGVPTALVFEVVKYSCILYNTNADKGASQTGRQVSIVSAYNIETMVPSHLTNVLEQKGKNSKKSKPNKFMRTSIP